MKRILAAALSLALLVSLAACGGKDRFDTGKVEEGVCYQLTGIAPDTVAMRVDGIDVPMDMYFYNLCYAASYMESYMNMYGMDLDWSMELQEDETVLDVTKDSILENTKSFAVIEKLAQEKNQSILLLERESARLEQKKATAELEQKQRAALNAAKVERLNHGEETKPEPKAEEKSEQPAAEEPAEGEKRRSWFSLRRREDGKDEEQPTEEKPAEQPETKPEDAPAPEAVADEQPAVEEPAAEPAPADAADDENEDMCDGHCDTCKLECDAAGDKGTEEESAEENEDKPADQ